MAKQVLIVDDSATARMLIQRCIEIAGWTDAEFHEAGNGREALAQLGNLEADLLITDLNMPKMDGVELLQAVRAHNKYNSLPVIVISSAGNEAKLKQLRELGVNDILSKPVTPAQVMETLDNMFGDEEDA